MRSREMDETDDFMRDLRAELMAVEPSPAFAAGVRQRIEARGSAWTRLTFSLAVATTAFAVVAGGAYWLSRTSPIGPDAAGPLSESMPPPVAPVSEPGAMQPTKPASRGRMVAAVKPASVRAVAEVNAVNGEAPAGPFLEVITNQPELIRRMRSKFSPRAVFEPSNVSNEIEITVAPIVVNEIQVPVIGGAVPGKGAQVIRNDAARSTR